MTLEGLAEESERGSATELRTGFVVGHTFGFKPVEYTADRGEAIFEGDIVLGTLAQMDKLAEEARSEAAVIVTGEQFRWPRGNIPFTIDPSLRDRKRVDDAIAHWHARTNVRLVQRTDEVNFVTFRPGSGCSSMVGMRGGEQFITLADGCDRGSTIHEIGHAAGLWHEQSREDRDRFIRVNWQNIEPGREHNFNQHITDGDDVGAYDYDSIMHYSATAFSRNGLPTIETVNGAAIGQRGELSDGDVAAVNLMYPGGDWSGWHSLGGGLTSDVTVAANADGRLEVLARGGDNALWHLWQTAPSNGWSGWESLGGGLTSNIAVGRNADGRLEVFVRGGDNALWHLWQTAPSNGWSGWESLGGGLTSDVTVAANADGRLEVFARGGDNALWHLWQTAPSNGWSGWESLGGGLTSPATVGRNADGRLEVFVRGMDNALWHMRQTAPNNGWSGWESLGGGLTTRAAVGSNADGRLEAFARGFDNALWHLWQS